jgi:hypothetical protein
VKNALLAEIDIPFFSALYRRISEAPLSLLDVTCLIVAIPATIATKLACGKAPFQNGLGDELVTAPGTVFESLSLPIGDGASAQVEGMSDAPQAATKPPGGPIPYAVSGSCRLIRTAMLPTLTSRAISPVTPPGTDILVVADRLMRALVADIGLTIGNTTLRIVNGLTSSLSAFFWGALYLAQGAAGNPVTANVATPAALAGKLGDNFNLLGAIDGVCDTSVGIWAMVLTAEGWDNKTDAQRSAEILNEIVSTLSLVAFVANAVARRAETPPTIGFAVGVAAVRGVGQFGNAISEFVVAGQAAQTPAPAPA